MLRVIELSGKTHQRGKVFSGALDELRPSGLWQIRTDGIG